MKADTQRLLQALLDAEFEFVVIGGTAALAHGVMTPTQDLDVEPLGGFDVLETIELPLGIQQPVRVLSLDQLIAVKTHLQRPKDKIVAAELLSIRARRQSSG